MLCLISSQEQTLYATCKTRSCSTNIPLTSVATKHILLLEDAKMFHLVLSLSLMLLGVRLLPAATIEANADTYGPIASWGSAPGAPGFQPPGSFRGPGCLDTHDQSAVCTSSYDLDLTDTSGVVHSLHATATATTTTTYGSIRVIAAVSPIEMPSGFQGYGAAQAWGMFEDTITIYSTTANGVLVARWNRERELDEAVLVDYTTFTNWSSGVPVFFGAQAYVAAERGFGSFKLPPFNSANLILLDITVALDFSGTPLSNFSYSTESGTPYNVIGGTFVPEPSSLVLVGAGMLLLCHRLRRAQLTRS
jgi:hypothetical protein